MRLKNTPTLTKGIVTNHMTTKAIIMAKKVTTIHTKGIIMKAITMRLMTIRTMATIMKAITMRLMTIRTMVTIMKGIITKATTMMLTKVMTTTTDTLMV